MGRRALCGFAALTIAVSVQLVPVEAQLGSDAEAAAPHTPPVDGEVIDPFRPPDEPWRAGNRGIEYATEPGETAAATADGIVVFAGFVAGHGHVTIRHTADLVTTVAFVSEILVEEGQHVTRGQALAVVGASVHFTARRSGVYIDPESLFGHWAWVLRLVPPIE